MFEHSAATGDVGSEDDVCSDPEADSAGLCVLVSSSSSLII
jgi:hypothetical protein